MPTRRNFLKIAASLTGAAAITGFVPDSIQRAYAIDPAPGTTWADAEHVVILMQENRSFDHMLGTLRGVRGFNDPRAFRLPNGNSVFVQTDDAGNSYAPWRLDIRDTRVTWMGSLPHSRQSQVDAWNEGRHDKWLDAKRSGRKQYAELPLTMGYYTREDLPFYYALADAFTVCDQNYCSVMTSTSPNRCYLWSGTVRDEKKPGANVHVRNEVIDDGGLTWKTFPERLQEAGISWKSYQNELTNSGLTGEAERWLSNYGDDTLECFSAYHVEAHEGAAATFTKRVAELRQDAAKLEAQLRAEKNAAAAADLKRQLALINRKIQRFNNLLADGSKLSDQERALHDAAFTTNAGDKDFRQLASLSYQAEGKRQTMNVPKSDIFYQFRKDVNEGKLPTVSWLTAPENFSDHPSAPWYGAWYVSEVMDILTKNPEVWKKTIFILTYDENDGYFDHGPSYVAADPRRPETGGASDGMDTALEYVQKEEECEMGIAGQDARTAPIGMGFRVPMIVASPWSRGGWVNSQLFDHTSTLKFLERFIQKKFNKNVREDNISEWRRTVVGDLTSVFRPYDGRKNELHYLDRDEYVVSIEQARFKGVPANFKKLAAADIAAINRGASGAPFAPRQEPGTKPSCALPYELYADGNLSADGKYFELRLSASQKVHGDNSAGAPFNVYLRNLRGDNRDGFQAATYAVKAGSSLTRRIEMSRFSEAGYAIEVHASNGFYRVFSGTASAQPVTAKLEYETKGAGLTGNGVVHLYNSGRRAARVLITHNAYGLPARQVNLLPGETSLVLMNLQAARGWYDFTVSVKSPSIEARFAGRIETGRVGITDPAMG